MDGSWKIVSTNFTLLLLLLSPLLLLFSPLGMGGRRVWERVAAG